MMIAPTDLTTQPPQEIYGFIQDLETYQQTDGRGRTPEAAHVRQYVREELTRVKIELTRRGLPRVEPGRERSYGPGQAAWQKDKAERPTWALLESIQLGALAHLIPAKIWSRPKTELSAICGIPSPFPSWTQVARPTHALCTECVRLTGYQEEPEPDPVPERECPLLCNDGVVGRSPEGELVFCSCGPGRRAEIAWWRAYLTVLESLDVPETPRHKSEISVARRWITELQAQLHRREAAWTVETRDAIVDRVEDERHEEIYETIAPLEETELTEELLEKEPWLRRWLKDMDRPQRGDQE